MNALSPHHFGEDLVAKLLSALGDHLTELPALGADAENSTLGKLGDLGTIRAVSPLVALDQIAGANGEKPLSFDGMHDIDCAIEHQTNESSSIFALELKLGLTQLGAPAFKHRVEKRKPTLDGRRISGSMVSILDRRQASGKKLVLRSHGVLVQRRWGLVVREQTLAVWKNSKSGNGATGTLAERLGLSHLAAILTLEQIARSLGPSRARWLALSIATESIASWFPEA